MAKDYTSKAAKERARKKIEDAQRRRVAQYGRMPAEYINEEKDLLARLFSEGPSPLLQGLREDVEGAGESFTIPRKLEEIAQSFEPEAIRIPGQAPMQAVAPASPEAAAFRATPDLALAGATAGAMTPVRASEVMLASGGRGLVGKAKDAVKGAVQGAKGEARTADDMFEAAAAAQKAAVKPGTIGRQARSLEELAGKADDVVPPAPKPTGPETPPVSKEKGFLRRHPIWGVAGAAGIASAFSKEIRDKAKDTWAIMKGEEETPSERKAREREEFLMREKRAAEAEERRFQRWMLGENQKATARASQMNMLEKIWGLQEEQRRFDMQAQMQMMQQLGEIQANELAHWSRMLAE